MKKFLLGLVVGVVLGATGGYAVVMDKIKKTATIENVEKVSAAAETFSNSIVEIVK